MKKVTIWEAKTNLSQLIQAVHTGETVFIFKKNQAIAQLLPLNQKKSKSLFELFTHEEQKKARISEDFALTPDDFNGYLP